MRFSHSSNVNPHQVLLGPSEEFRVLGSVLVEGNSQGQGSCCEDAWVSDSLQLAKHVNDVRTRSSI